MNAVGFGVKPAGDHESPYVQSPSCSAIGRPRCINLLGYGCYHRLCFIDLLWVTSSLNNTLFSVCFLLYYAATRLVVGNNPLVQRRKNVSKFLDKHLSSSKIILFDFTFDFISQIWIPTREWRLTLCYLVLIIFWNIFTAPREDEGEGSLINAHLWSWLKVLRLFLL